MTEDTDNRQSCWICGRELALDRPALVQHLQAKHRLPGGRTPEIPPESERHAPQLRSASAIPVRAVVAGGKEGQARRIIEAVGGTLLRHYSQESGRSLSSVTVSPHATVVIAFTPFIDHKTETVLRARAADAHVLALRCNMGAATVARILKQAGFEVRGEPR